MPPLAYSTFVTMLRSIPATDPVLLLATSEDEVKTVDEVLLRDLFALSRKNRREIETPSNVSCPPPPLDTLYRYIH